MGIAALGQQEAIDIPGERLTLRVSEGCRCARLRRAARFSIRISETPEPIEPDPGHAGEGTGRLQPPRDRFSMRLEGAGRLQR
jgi:hypothetical protein